MSDASDSRLQGNNSRPRASRSKIPQGAFAGSNGGYAVGEVAAAKTILRDYINATVGFTRLSKSTGIPSKSLMRMFGPTGNPPAENLFEVVSFLQHPEGVRFSVKSMSA